MFNRMTLCWLYDVAALIAFAGMSLTGLCLLLLGGNWLGVLLLAAAAVLAWTA